MDKCVNVTSRMIHEFAKSGVKLRHLEFGNEMFGWWAAPYDYEDGFKWDSVDVTRHIKAGIEPILAISLCVLCQCAHCDLNSAMCRVALRSCTRRAVFDESALMSMQALFIAHQHHRG